MEYVDQDRFEDHLKESDDKYKIVLAHIKEIRSELENRVTYKHFTWVLGILITILISLFGYIANQITDVQGVINVMSKDVSNTNSNVSRIQGKLEPYNVYYKE